MIKSILFVCLCAINISTAQLVGVAPKRIREKTTAVRSSTEHKDESFGQYKPNLRNGNKERFLQGEGEGIEYMSISVPLVQAQASLSLPSDEDTETSFPTFFPTTTPFPTSADATSFPTFNPTTKGS